MRTETICALATPSGEGAVGMIRISGPEALALARRLCGSGVRLEPRVMHAVTPRRDGEVLDQALICYMPGPRSYTGEDVVELFGHGGALNMERLLAAILGLGARPAQPGEFTRRAFFNGRLDLTQAEAVGQVVGACSEQALRNAQALLSGELGAQVAQVREGLVELAAGLEAQVDFAEDVSCPLDAAGAQADLHRAGASLGELCRSYEHGRRLDGATVALVGPVNAGKSSLFNRLLGRERALVASEPGTTRDYLEAEVSWEGQRVILVDTAGERAAQSSLERAGQTLAGPMLQRCALTLHVFDASASSQGPSRAGARSDTGPSRAGARSDTGPSRAGARSDDTGPHDPEPDSERVQVANKVDLLTPDQRRALPEGTVATSALDGTGMDQLRQRILEQLTPGQVEGVMVTRQRQRDLLHRAQRACVEAGQALDGGLGPELVAEHIREALSALGEVTGERYTEDVLDAVFSTFCIGK